MAVVERRGSGASAQTQTQTQTRAWEHGARVTGGGSLGEVGPFNLDLRQGHEVILIDVGPGRDMHDVQAFFDGIAEHGGEIGRAGHGDDEDWLLQDAKDGSSLRFVIKRKGDPDAAEPRLGEWLRAVGGRFGLTPTLLLAALESCAWGTPAQAEHPVAAMSAADEAVLREAGSLRERMPDLGSRASTRTALLAARVLEDALSVKEAAARLKVTEGRVRQRITARTLLGVESGGMWRLPSFQFTDSGELRGIDRVLQAFPDDVHPVSVLRFLDSPHLDLMVNGDATSPREWLASGGDIQRVAELAADAYALP